jgi:hypothetical protein
MSMFYTQLKCACEYVDFIFITGVSKVARTMVLDRLNLIDVSLQDELSAFYGFTQVEIEANFGGHLSRLAERHGLTMPDLLAGCATGTAGSRSTASPSYTAPYPSSASSTRGSSRITG